MRLASLAPFLFAATAAAQHVVTYDPAPAGLGLFFEKQVLSLLVPGPLPPEPGYGIAGFMPPVAPVGAPPGDATFDGLRNRIWHTNGLMLAAQSSLNFALMAPPIAPFPIAAGVLAAIGGPVTGMALDPVANVMFLATAANVVIGVTPVPGTPVAVPPFPLPFLPAPLTGLDYDSITNSLFACDANGLVFNVAIGGGLLAPPIGPMGMPGVAGDVCIDKTTLLNAAGVRPIYVVAGPAIRDITTPLAPISPNGGVAPTGLAFLGRAANQPGPSGTCGGFTPNYMTLAPMTTGNAGFGLRVKDLPALSPMVFALDWAFNPVGLPIFGGSPLHLIPGSPGIVTFLGFADAAGEARMTISLAGVPAGVGALYTQALWPCAAHPSGFALTEMQSFQVTGH